MSKATIQNTLRLATKASDRGEFAKSDRFRVMAVTDAVKESLAKHVKGYVFKGAFPEAIEAGFTKGSFEYRLFTGLFLNDLPEVVTNKAGELI